VQDTRIPVLGHAEEFVIYVDKAADIDKAEIAVDAKTQYPAACNIETLLVHQSIASAFLPLVAVACKNTTWS